jgi:methylenetetrahydrofolate--tRNA-(uracil-5-)-methyltransferase
VRKKIRDKKERHRLVCERSLAEFDAWWSAAVEKTVELRR